MRGRHTSCTSCTQPNCTMQPSSSSNRVPAPVALVDGVCGGQHAVDQLRVGAAHLLNQVRQQRLRGGAGRGGAGWLGLTAAQMLMGEAGRAVQPRQTGSPPPPCPAAAQHITRSPLPRPPQPPARHPSPRPTPPTPHRQPTCHLAGKSCEEMMESASLSCARTRGGADSIRSVMCALIWSCTHSRGMVGSGGE